MIKFIKLLFITSFYVHVLAINKWGLENNVHDEHIKCLNKVLSRFNALYTCIAYDEHPDLIDATIKNIIKNEIIIVNFESNMIYEEVMVRPEVVLIITSSIPNYDEYINGIYSLKHFDSQVKVVIVYLGDGDLNTIFRCAWSKYFQNVLVIDKNNNVYTTRRYKETCGEDMKKTFLGRCEHVRDRVILAAMNRAITNFYGCHVRVLAFPLPPYVVDITSNTSYGGLEPTIFESVAQKMNFTIDYIQHDYKLWGAKLANGKYTESIRALYEKKVDVIFGSLRVLDEYLEDFEASLHYYSNIIAFHIPTSPRLNPSEGLIRVYSPLMWAAIMVTIIGFSVFAYTIERASSWRTHYLRTLEVTIEMFLSITAPKPKAAVLRIVFLTWALFSKVIVMSYEATFQVYMLQKFFTPPIETMEQLENSGLQIGMIDITYSLFPDNKSDIVECMPDDNCIRQAAFSRDLAFFVNTRFVDYVVMNNKWFDKYDRPLLYKMQTFQFEYYSGIMYTKGFPLKKKLQSVMSYFAESGLLDKWIDENNYEPFKWVVQKSSKITMQYLYYILWFYGVGMVVSLLVLVGELVVDRHRPYEFVR